MGNTTNKEIMLRKLQEILGADHVFPEEPMAKHITFRVGGPAEWFVQADTVEQLKQVIALCKEQAEPYYIIGNGSDLLVSDEGVRGVIIRLTGEFAEISAKESVNLGVCDVCAGAGVMLATLSLRAGKKGLYRFGICKRNSGYGRRCGVNECRSLRRRNQGFYCGRGCYDKRW